jgi:uracil phosphoribosyltransferase
LSAPVGQTGSLRDGPGHAYGPRVELVGDPWSHSALARVCSPDVRHTELLALVRSLYRGLAQRAFGRELPTVDAAVPTRMAAVHREQGVVHGRHLDPAARTVIVDIIRGGIVPAQICFETLTEALPVDHIRLDHLNMARRADDQGRVLGVDLSGSKVGGSTAGATVVFPDPMGATGSTILRAFEHLAEAYGRPGRVICLPLIATPEFLRAVLDGIPEAVIYALRLDRGLSDPDVLASPPGTHWARERGLNDQGYIVPGAGGMGEVLNNSWC